MVVNGRPLDSYFQSLTVIIMLNAELVYQAIWCPIRFTIVWRLQAAAMAALSLSLATTLYAANFQLTAAPSGLDVLGIIAIIINIVLCIAFIFYICYGYWNKAVVWQQKGMAWCNAKWQRVKQGTRSKPMPFVHRANWTASGGLLLSQSSSGSSDLHVHQRRSRP